MTLEVEQVVRQRQATQAPQSSERVTMNKAGSSLEEEVGFHL